jgi:hypothetical protein
VPAEYLEEAEMILKEQPLTDEELDEAAGSSSEPSGEDDPGREQLLDSGIERIRFTTPEEPPDEKTA